MPRAKGQKDVKKRSKGAGGARENSGGARENSGGARENSGGARANSGGEREGAGAPEGVPNHMLPKTRAKKLVEDGWSMYAEGHFKEALALFEEATVVDPNNGHAFESVSKLSWKLRYILTNGDISNDEMQRCLSSAEESQRLGWEGAEGQVMFLRAAGPRGRGAILPSYLPGLLIYYEAHAGKLSTDPVGASVMNLFYGVVLWEAKQPELAMIAFQKSAELNPGNFSAFHNRSCVLRSVGRYPEAVEDVEASLRLRPAFGPSRLLLEELQLACASSAAADYVVLVDADLHGDADLHDYKVDDATSSEHHDGIMEEDIEEKVGS
jgi:tetratricopeptide (TPR) repeat protein